MIVDINEFSQNGMLPSLSERTGKDILFNVLKLMQNKPGLNHKIILEIDNIYQIKSGDKKKQALSELVQRINDMSADDSQKKDTKDVLFI